MARAHQPDGRLMQLGLSSAAAPGAGVAELAVLCRQRGLAAVELEHALCRTFDDAHAALSFAGASPAFAGILVTDLPASLDELAGASWGLDSPAVIAGDAPLAQRIEVARRVVELEGDAAVLVRGAVSGWLEQVTAAGVRFVWEVDASCCEPAADVRALTAASAMPEYIRLIGGGPEAVMQEGRGIGAFMAQLALAGYAAPLVLVPSSPKFRVAWGTWLGRRGGWGCGSDRETVAQMRLSTMA